MQKQISKPNDFVRLFYKHKKIDAYYHMRWFLLEDLGLVTMTQHPRDKSIQGLEWTTNCKLEDLAKAAEEFENLSALRKMIYGWERDNLAESAKMNEPFRRNFRNVNTMGEISVCTTILLNSNLDVILGAILTVGGLYLAFARPELWQHWLSL